MRFRKLAAAFAARNGIGKRPSEVFLRAFFGEMVHQLVLGETVRLPGLGKFEMLASSRRPRRVNLPGLPKFAVPKARWRIRFTGKDPARLSREALRADWAGGTLRRAIMPKRRKEMVVEIPEDVESITIKIKKDKKAKKGTESGTRKRRLLG